MKKLLSLSLSVCLFSTFAFGNSYSLQNELNKAYEELEVSLNVEWDQKDQEFYKKQAEAFSQKIKKLQKEGISNQELFDFAKSKVKNKKVVAQLDKTFKLIETQKLSQEQSRKLVTDIISKAQTQGANWAGDVLLITAVAVVLIVSIAYAASYSRTSYQPYCWDEYVCYDYYDSWGYYLYSDCFYETYCN